MKRRRFDLLAAALVLGVLILAGCGAASQDSESRVATRVAEDRAVAATLTAEAAPATDGETAVVPAESPTAEVVAQAVAAPEVDAETVTEVATTPPVATPTPIVATVVPPATPTLEAAATATQIVATVVVIAVEVSPTPTPIIAAVIPTDGSQGDGREILIGENGRAVLLPGIPTAASPVVFDDFLTAARGGL